MHAEDKADILRKKWDKANRFTRGELNTLAFKVNYPRYGAPQDYVNIVDEIWNDLNAWAEDEIPSAMITPVSRLDLI